MDLQQISSDFMNFHAGDTLDVVSLNSLLIPVNESIISIELHAAEVDQSIVLQLVSSFAEVFLRPAQAFKFFSGDRPLRAGIDPILQGLIVVLAGTEMGKDSDFSGLVWMWCSRGLGVEIRFIWGLYRSCIYSGNQQDLLEL